MNFITLMKQCLRGPGTQRVEPTTDARPDEEPLPWTLSAGDVLAALFTVTATVLLYLALLPATVAHGRWLASLASAGLLLVFSDAFVRRRKNALAATLYPWLMGVFLILAAFPLLAKPALNSAAAPVMLGAVWAFTGLFFWQRYQAPSAVSQVVTGLFSIVVVPLVMQVYKSTTGGGPAMLGSGLLYLTAFGFGMTCSWLGLKFDQLDVHRTGVYSRIAFWFHSKGAIGMTVGLLLPYLATHRLVHFALHLSSGIETAMGFLCLLMGTTAVFLSLRWNRKYYLWAGTSLLSMGLCRLVPVNPLWLALVVLLGMSSVLYAWDTLSRNVRRVGTP